MNHTVTGYRKRPWELTTLAICFALVPLASWISWYIPVWTAGRPESLLQVLVGYFSTAGNGVIGLLHSLLVIALWILFWFVAWGVFRVTRWGFILCLVAAVANSLFSMVWYGVGQGDAGIQEHIGFNPLQVGVAINLVFFVPVVILLRRKIMTPFFNPRLKWWEQHPRVKALLKIDATISGELKTYKSFDLSASGMFLSTDDVPRLRVGDSFPATIHLEDTGAKFAVECKTVWISDGKGKAPQGCGVTFEYSGPGQKKLLHQYIQKRIREGHLVERT